MYQAYVLVFIDESLKLNLCMTNTIRARNVWENREIFGRKTLEKSLLEQCDDAEEDRPVSEVASVTSCDVGTTPSDVPSNSNSKGPSRPVQWTRPQSLLVFVLFIDTQNCWRL